MIYGEHRYLLFIRVYMFHKNRFGEHKHRVSLVWLDMNGGLTWWMPQGDQKASHLILPEHMIPLSYCGGICVILSISLCLCCCPDFRFFTGDLVTYLNDFSIPFRAALAVLEVFYIRQGHKSIAQRYNMIPKIIWSRQFATVTAGFIAFSRPLHNI